MLTKAIFACIIASALSLACSSSGTSGASGAGSPPSSGTLAGTVGSKPFTMKSGFGHANADGSLDLIFSSEEGVCDLAKAAQIRGGETLIQLYTLKGTVPGAYKSANDDIKYASVKSTCTSGIRLEDTSIDKSARATTSTVTLTALTAATVEGTLDVKFADGSTATGTFKVPTCSATTPESSVCL